MVVNRKFPLPSIQLPFFLPSRNRVFTFFHFMKNAILVTLALVLPFPLLLPGFFVTLACLGMGLVMAFVLSGPTAALWMWQTVQASIKWWITHLYFKLFGRSPLYTVRNQADSSFPNSLNKLDPQKIETLYSRFYRPTSFLSSSINNNGDHGTKKSRPGGNQYPTLSITTTGRFNDMPLHSA